MIWRAWCCVAGLPVGVLAALALGTRQAAVFAGVVVGFAGLWLGVAWWIARTRDDDPARPDQVAGAASVGLAAVGGAVGALLRLTPGPAVWLALQLLVASAAFALASRRVGPFGGAARQLLVGALWLVAGFACVLGVAALAAWSAPRPQGTLPSPESVYDVDARVATRTLPRCAEEGARVRVLHPAGARPRLDPEGGVLWFDAAAGDTGRRQIHRLDLATAALACPTCGEPGGNLRPAPGEAGVLFETDRFATPIDPTNHEIALLRHAAREPSRRLTRSPGPDTHPSWAPGTGRVVWSRRERGYEVVWARIQSAHGALLLGLPGVLARGGASWVAPEAWSPDARSLVLLRGNPFAPLRARMLDPATGESRELGPAVVPGGVAFGGDGGVVAVASSQRARAAGLLPDALATLFAPLAQRTARDGVLFRGTALVVGETGGSLRPLPLPAVETWGAPTGIALSPDGRRLYLGQRAPSGAERLLEIVRDCAP